MISACEEHRNSGRDFIVIHDYSTCPVCEMDDLLDDQEEQISNLQCEVEDLEHQFEEELEKIVNKHEQEIDDLQDEIKTLSKQIDSLNEGK